MLGGTIFEVYTFEALATLSRHPWDQLLSDPHNHNEVLLDSHPWLGVQRTTVRGEGCSTTGFAAAPRFLPSSTGRSLIAATIGAGGHALPGLRRFSFLSLQIGSSRGKLGGCKSDKLDSDRDDFVVIHKDSFD